MSIDARNTRNTTYHPVSQVMIGNVSKLRLFGGFLVEHLLSLKQSQKEKCEKEQRKQENSTLNTQPKTAKPLGILFIALWLAACTPVQEPSVPEPAPEPAPVIPELSSEAIKDASKEQLFFAQSALKKLGYRVGPVDGIWGPWSAREIRKFEVQQNIKSAEGFLSELNLDRLAKESGLSQESVNNPPSPKKTLSSKLEGALVDTGPQLIIVERDYDVFIEANPFSEKVQRLTAGTGIYVIAEKEGWYQVELINRKQGYLQAD